MWMGRDAARLRRVIRYLSQERVLLGMQLMDLRAEVPHEQRGVAGAAGRSGSR